MGTLLIWRNGVDGPSETRRVTDLEDLRDLVRVEFGSRITYVVARELDGLGETLDQHLRLSPDDLTDEDFRWLTAPVSHQVRGVSS